MSGFLRYVVDRALAGEGDQVKEYVVGVAVLSAPRRPCPGSIQSSASKPGGCARSSTAPYSGDRRTTPSSFTSRAAAMRPRSNSARQMPPRPGTSDQFGAYRAPQLATWVRCTHRRGPPRAAGGCGDLAVGPLDVGWPRHADRHHRGPAIHRIFERDGRRAPRRAPDRRGDERGLARIRTLGVITFAERPRPLLGTRRPLREIAQTLNAELILEASVSTEGEGVRISARLVERDNRSQGLQWR